MRHNKQIICILSVCCMLNFSCVNNYTPESYHYIHPETGNTIPQLDSTQIMDYIKEKGDTFHLVYCYGGGCPSCDELLPSFLAFAKAENISYSIMIIERATDSILVTSAIREICHQGKKNPIIILSDSLYDISYRYCKPQTKRICPIITYGNNGKGDCNKYDRYLEQCVPDFRSYWHPRILLYHVNKGVIYDAKNNNGTALTSIEKESILSYIYKRSKVQK